MQKNFILLAMTLTTSLFAADPTPEKVAACSAINFKNSNSINECISSNAVPEKVSACASVGYAEDIHLLQCLYFTRATPSKIAACLDVGYKNVDNFNDCLSINAEIFKISACASLGMSEENINKCIRKI